METQFEIHSRLEKKHYVEYFQCIWSKRIIVVMIFALLGVFLLALHFLTDGYHLFTGIWGVAYAIWLYFRPWIVAGKTMKRETKFEETDVLLSVTKFGDLICDEAPNHTATAQYDKIENIFISKNVIVLRDIRKADFILDKNGFTKGTLEEFLPFIQEKCPQLKLPKW